MNEHGSRFGGSGGDRIDRVIDRAVRAMMWADPPAGLRRRVLSRLEAPPRRASLLLRFALAAAALVVLATGAVLLRESGPAATAPHSTIANAGPAKALEPAARVNPPAPPPASDATAARRNPPRRDSLIRMPAIGNVFGPPDGRVTGASVVEPGAARPLVIEGAIEPGAPGATDAAIVSSWTPAALQTDELTIAPLEVKPLQVAPLPPRK